MICPKTAKQDKVGGIFPPTRNFACRKMTSGKPAFVVPMVRGGDRLKEKHQKIGVQRHIRIADIEMIEQIERLTKLPGYESANKVINEALFYGMPILYEKLTGGMVTEEEKEDLIAPRKSGSTDEEFYAALTRLLNETVLNVTINKSILSSLFNFISEKYSDEQGIIQKFNKDFSPTLPNISNSLRRRGLEICVSKKAASDV